VNTMETIAHVRQLPDGGWETHPLPAHLEGTAERAANFAADFGGGEWARLAALWHDLGKYRPEFQHYIRKQSGYDLEAHLEGAAGRVDHSTAGALHAVEKFGVHGRILAYLIAGHHAGLPDWFESDAGGSALRVRLNQTELLGGVATTAPPGLLDRPQPTSHFLGGREGFPLWVRMLFSCLADADFLDTEAFMDGKKGATRQGFPVLDELNTALDAHLAKVLRDAKPTPVNRLRAGILRHCREGAAREPGFFSLTVPTGGGKTLSSLAFALEHARRHGKRRVIYAIPYTSIIEQTAGTFRAIFGDESVVEHHSNLDTDRETVRSRLAAENWDAPLVVTTNVQFFESLFAAKSSRCRKLHNIAGSVVVLDEAQCLPPEFLQPILGAMNLLEKHYGVSFVLCTATQPPLDSRQGFGWAFRGLSREPWELMPDPEALYAQLERVTVELPQDWNTRRNWEDLAAELQGHESVLCIVNTREDCRTLHGLMPKDTLHLSALMCGEHRARAIADIKQRLGRGEPVRVVSTQLVEAGVDLDFPVVYRALAGLDSIAQAAGRCNREGLLERGRVVVFQPPKPAPIGLLRKAEQAATALLMRCEEGNPLSRAAFRRYFEQFFAATDLDGRKIGQLQKTGDGLEVQFRSTAEAFRLIDESGYRPVFVRYGESPALIGQLEAMGPERWLLRKLQRYTVNLPENQFQKLLARGDIREIEIQKGFFAQAADGLYDDSVGLRVEQEIVITPSDLIG